MAASYTVSENYGTYQGNTSYISDGNTNNCWRGDNKSSQGKYVMWTFDQDVVLTAFNYSTTQSSEIFGTGQYLQTSLDGSSWTDAGQFTGKTPCNFTGLSVKCRYVRIYCKSGSDYVSISEAALTWSEDTGGGGSGGGGGEVVEGQARNFEYTGAVQSVTLPAGKYKLECWGAQGGTYQSYAGGKGGYSVGTITLATTTTVYVYVGGQPAATGTSRAKTPGGFNGGGTGQNRYYSSTYTYGQGGGGGTDIRIGTDSLYSRVIVAGGGAGSASDNATTKWGGGETGGPGGSTSSSAWVAEQTAPSTSGRYVAGTFGQGAAAYASRTDYQCGSGGGGGGWYGGYAYNYAQDSQTALRGYCGGGSGYVYTSSTASNYPSGCTLNSGYYLEDAQTIGGNTSFPSTNGSSETGHEGNGYVRITSLIVASAGPKLYFKQSGKFVQAVKAYRKTGGKWVEQDSTALTEALSGLKNGDPVGCAYAGAG